MDESGDSGFKFDCGSSRYFVITAVIFAENFSADACDRSIDCLRQKLGFVSRREFHFSECPDKIREEFFRCVAAEDFLYHAFVINKQCLYPGANNFRDGKSFYQFAVSIVCENARSLLQDAKIVIDKNGDRAFKRELESRMKKQMVDGNGNCLIRKVAMEASHSNNLVQLADMVCGAVARSFNTNDDAQKDRFRKLIKRREKRVQFWPK
jgi:Protein of unknown function (DUF3800)